MVRIKQQKSLFQTVTNRIILVNIIVYLFILLGSTLFGITRTLELIALQPDAIIMGDKLWTILTSMFSHYAFMHLFVNMFSLYFLGTFVERIVGKKRFFIFYMIAGLFAGIFTAVLSGFFTFNPLLASIFGDPSIFALGASGALFGLVGILAVLTPRVKVFFLAGPLVAFLLMSIIPSSGPYAALFGILSFVVMIYLFASIFFMMSFDPKYTKYALPVELPMWVLPIIAIVPLVVLSIFIDLPIGNMAHFGGLIAGLVYAAYLKKKYPKRSKMVSRMFQ